jgi:fido (protein-threonine AMPylation protein)
MSDDVSRAAAVVAREVREGALVFARIRELDESPVQGDFSLAHLVAVHGYIFQDLPHHQPGIVRDNTGPWIKMRALEAAPGVYEVNYMPEKVEARITSVLASFGGPDALKGLSIEVAALKLARLYGDLDHAHGFYEGNSRTLREFTRELTLAAGFTLDWTGTNVTRESRNFLYAARDIEVISRAFPGLTSETASTPQEHYSTLQLENFQRQLGDHPLEKIIRDGLAPAPINTIIPAAVHQSEPAPPKTADEYWNRVAEKGRARATHAPEQAQASVNQPYKGPVLE